MTNQFIQDDVRVDVEGVTILATVTYKFLPGRPAFTPRGEYAPIDPPEPAEIDILGVDVDGMPVPAWFKSALQESGTVYRWLLDHHMEPEQAKADATEIDRSRPVFGTNFDR